MIALEVELLTGRYVATSFNDRSEPEWPPHPARLFSALVATAHEDEELIESVRPALEWLEKQGAPEIDASVAERRTLLPAYVPENSGGVVSGWANAETKLSDARSRLIEAEASGDAKAIKAAQKAVATAEKKFEETLHSATLDDGKGNALDAARLLPASRSRQPRLLPAFTPHVPKVRYSWPTSEAPPEVREKLGEVSRRVVRLGHSSSFVACRVLDDVGPTQATFERWRPTEKGGVSMRVVESGQLSRLEGAFARHRGVEPRVLPSVPQSYARGSETAAETPRSSVFGEWLTFREISSEETPRLGLRLSRTEDLTRALRGALLSHAEAPVPPVLSGHDENGRPSERPHVAYVPLADIGSNYSSGAVLGLAVVLPRGISSEERRAVLRAIGRWEESGTRLTLGRSGALRLERVLDADPRRTLDPAYWNRPARRWGSVTPIALDRNPGNLYSDDPREAAEAARNAEEIVKKSCERIGLPPPRWVEVLRRSLFDAAPPARSYGPFPSKSASGNATRRVCVHIEMCFEEPVAGPVLIGAGRFFGLGLCRGREG